MADLGAHPAAAARLPALVVAQAGPGIGLGHLSRARVVARALQRHLGARVQLLVQGPPLPPEDWQGLPHAFIGADADLGAAIAAHLPGGAAVLCLDLQPQQVPADLAQRLPAWRAAGCRVVAIDGPCALRDRLDLVFIPAIGFPPPAGLPPDGAPLRHGWDCLLFDPPDPVAGPAPEGWAALPGPRVLALTGGSDATGLGRHWPALLDRELPASCELHWVTGPFAEPPRWPAPARLAAQVHTAPAGLGPLMDRCHLAVTVFGVSVWELLARGVPTVVFSPYGDRDADLLAELADSGAALVARDEADAARQLCALVHEPARAAHLSRQARARTQHSGGATLAALLADLLKTPAP